MADYSRQHDFSVKDALTTGDPDKVIKGSEVDEEFDALVTAVASKINVLTGHTTNDIAYLNSVGQLVDAGILYTDLARLTTTQTITGDKTFSGAATFSGATIVPTPSADTHAVTKAYVDAFDLVTRAYGTSTSDLAIGTTAATSLAVISMGTITLPTTGIITLKSIIAELLGGSGGSGVRVGLKVDGTVYDFGKYTDAGTEEYFTTTVGATETDRFQGDLGAGAAKTRFASPTLDIAYEGMSTGSQAVSVVLYSSTNAGTLKGTVTTSRAAIEVVDLT